MRTHQEIPAEMHRPFNQNKLGHIHIHNIRTPWTSLWERGES